MGEDKSPAIAIILINWNNTQDTIECLESIMASDLNNYTLFLLDNNSQDNSILLLKDWIFQSKTKNISNQNPDPKRKTSHLFSHAVIKNDKETLSPIRLNITRDFLIQERLVLIENNKNLGFAKGNNLILNFILENNLKYEYCYLLNNDTVILPDTISILIKEMQNAKVYVANSLIYDYYQRDKIQFAGGKIYPWGKARFYAEKKGGSGRKSEFTHGCALMVHTSVFANLGVLTERFFHGEEDFEFSWRLKANKTNVWCFFRSIVYHKEGASVINYMPNKEQKLILSALNRIVDMKSQYPFWIWIIWKKLLLLHFLKLFRKNGYSSLKTHIQILKNINRGVNTMDEVDHNAVSLIMGTIGHD